MLRPIDQYFQQQEEPIAGCLFSLRNYLLHYHPDLQEAWKYRMPFYCYKGKMCCYLWVHRQYNKPYLGIVEGKRLDDPELLQEKRSRMKILLIEPGEDLPIEKISSLLEKVISFY